MLNHALFTSNRKSRPLLTQGLMGRRKLVDTDDCLKSWPTEAEALPLAHNLIACAKGAFQQSKWFRNSCVVMSSIPEGQRSKAIKELDLDQVKSSNDLPMERVLGLHWCTEKDKFAYP